MTLLETLTKDAKTSKWVGVFLLIAGFLSLLAPLGAGLSLTIMIGALLLMGGDVAKRAAEAAEEHGAS